jgi:hypothetical protein
MVLMRRLSAHIASNHLEHNQKSLQTQGHEIKSGVSATFDVCVILDGARTLGGEFADKSTG